MEFRNLRFRKEPRTHHHPCLRCGVEVDCPEHLEWNPDGYPVAWCPAVHERGEQVYCEDCVVEIDKEERCSE